ncbi:39S ribosomal protein L49, mitochondrial [Orchesella cincta]|uniref:Large ribosomal subunit protein mL49 n=1 Tax=Orchesella cincta TaxID=48709 RepID=A0A1D2MS03_ORCCI|nr:39S ribosomal protein L49, mitochondrial [Orchesella cincta]
MLQSIATKAFRFRPVTAFKTSTKCVVLPGNTEVGSLVGRKSYSYYKSRVEETPDKYTGYETSFQEWKYVEKLIPPTHVPEPPQDPSTELPSGWRLPNPPKDCPYNVRRTKNHMIPAYLKIEDRGQVRYTYIRRVEGNIWQLEKDIGQWLQDNYPLKNIITRTNEISRCVIIKGDLVEDVREWLIAQGF